MKTTEKGESWEEYMSGLEATQPINQATQPIVKHL